jgi:hypothetical protein
MLAITWFRIFCLPIKIKIYITVILPVVLYECETLALAVKEEHRLRVCENPSLRKIMDPRQRKQEEERELHNGFQSLCCPLDIYLLMQSNPGG